MRRIEISGPNGTIGGIEAGSGPPLVLVAGLGSTHRIWGEMPRVLGRSYRVVAPDNRGVGGSRDGSPFTLDRAAEDLLALIEQLGPGPVSLLGISMGGIISLKAALAAPGLIERLVLGSCAAHLSTHGRRSLELLRDLLLWVPPRRMGVNLMTLAFAPPFVEEYTPLVEQAAETYGLDILRDNIEDEERNTTRFIIMTKEPIDPDPDEGPVVTSFVFRVRNVPAALYKALGGGWQIREGKDFVSKENIEEMQKRTDWGDLLIPRAVETPAVPDDRKRWRRPDW